MLTKFIDTVVTQELDIDSIIVTKENKRYKKI